ncbi:hypothetical protein HYV71_00210 [Candidatus Uhrbacteria bacterium]|nr:hypothetical protein [Candidatus Uhrbacteria bacterium]
MTDPTRSRGLPSRDLHDAFGFPRIGGEFALDSIEAFQAQLLLLEHYSLERFNEIRSLGARFATYYQALESELFHGFSEEQAQTVRHLREQIEEVLNRVEGVLDEVRDFYFLQRIPDEGLREQFIDLIKRMMIDLDMVSELMRGLESDNVVDRYEATQQAIFSASHVHGIAEQYRAGSLVPPGAFFLPSVPGATYVGYSPNDAERPEPLSQQHPSTVTRIALPSRVLRLAREVPRTPRTERKLITMGQAQQSEALGLPPPRNGYLYLPYAVEGYYSTRTPYGNTVEQRNRLLAYQETIKRGTIAGALLEIRGAVDPDFLAWVVGKGIGDYGPIPEVEIAYSMPLPSGALYRFPIKLPRDLEASTLYPSPFLYHDPRDRAVVHAIRELLLHREKSFFINFLSGKTSASQSGGKPEFSSIRDYHAYEDAFWERIYSITASGRITAREERTRDTKDEIVRAAAEGSELRALVEQALLGTNRGARLWEETNGREEVRHTVIDAVISRIKQIRKIEYGIDPDSPIEQRYEDERRVLGYGSSLPREGFPLPVYYIVSDALMPFYQKKGDTEHFTGEYPSPHDRYEGLEGLRNFLSDPTLNRPNRTIEVYDPHADSGKEHRSEDRVSDVKAAKVYRNAVKDNIKRAETFFEHAQKERKILELSAAKGGETHEQKERRLYLIGVSERFRARLTDIKEIRRRLKLSDTEMERARHMIKNKGQRDSLLEQLEGMTDSGRYALQHLYQECIGSEKEWSGFAVRITSDVATNHIRLFYVILRDGSLICNIRKGTKDIVSVNHSDLAGGQNIYAGGELVFERMGTSSWGLREINNGSGHYKPSGLTLYYATSLLNHNGFDTSRARRIDSILRIDVDTGYLLHADQVSPISDPDALSDLS